MIPHDLTARDAIQTVLRELDWNPPTDDATRRLGQRIQQLGELLQHIADRNQHADQALHDANPNNRLL